MASRAETVVECVREALETLSFTYFDAGEYPLRRSPTQFIKTTTVGAEHNTEPDEPADLIGWYFGRLDVVENDRPPRVTWVPVGGTISPSTNRMPVAVGDKATRALNERQLELSAVIQGRDYEQTENLLHAVIAACNKAARVGIRYDGERWITQEPAANFAEDGQMVVLTCRAFIPVLGEENQNASILSVPTPTYAVIT